MFIDFDVAMVTNFQQAVFSENEKFLFQMKKNYFSYYNVLVFFGQISVSLANYVKIYPGLHVAVKLRLQNSHIICVPKLFQMYSIRNEVLCLSRLTVIHN